MFFGPFIVMSLCMVFTVLVLVYLLLPVVLSRLFSLWLGRSKIYKIIAPPITGLLMGLYCNLGISLALHHLRFDENLLSYTYPGDPFHIYIPIAGLISGVLIPLGIQFKTTSEKALLISGVCVLVAIALLNGFMTMAPE